MGGGQALRRRLTGSKLALLMYCSSGAVAGAAAVVGATGAAVVPADIWTCDTMIEGKSPRGSQRGGVREVPGWLGRTARCSAASEGKEIKPSNEETSASAGGVSMLCMPGGGEKQCCSSARPPERL